MRSRLVTAVAVLALLASASSLACTRFDAPAWHGPRTDHFDGHRFHGEPVPVGVLRFLGWMITREHGYWGDWRDAPPGPPPPRRVGAGELRVTFVNHATMLVQLDGLNVLTDPIYSKRASPLGWTGPARVRPPGIRFEDLPPIDVVLISHNHYDHLDLRTLRRLKQAHDPLFVVGLGNGALLRRAGITRVVELDWWDAHALGGGVDVVAVPARHASRRGLFDADVTLWCGFVVRGTRGSVYFAGDTGYGKHFAEIRRRLGAPRLALLPIGAFLPRWFMRPMHMSPEDAVRAHHDLGAATSVAMHFGTFPLGDDGEYQAPTELAQALDADDAAGHFWILDFGEGRNVP
jgi:L-ascorbate metabolism protein UlaG (beta-lactamase superfamily)